MFHRQTSRASTPALARSAFALFAGAITLALVTGCGGSSKHRIPTKEDPAAGPTPSAPEAMITQGFGVNDAIGNVLSVVVNYTLVDADAGDLVDVLVEYSVRRCVDDNFSPFQPAPEGIGSEGTTGLSTSTTPPGQVHTFVLDAVAAGFSGAGPVDLIIRITPSNDDATGATAESEVIHVGALSVLVQVGTSLPSVAPSFGVQVPVSISRNGLPVDEVTVVVAYTPGNINSSAVPVALGPAGSGAGASISGVSATSGRVEFTVGGGVELADGVIAYLQFDIAAGATGGAFPVLCIADIPTGSGTRGRYLGVRQCVDCGDSDGAVLLAGPAPMVEIGDSGPLAIPSTSNCLSVNLITNGVIMDQVTMTFAYDSAQLAPASMPVVLGTQAMAASSIILSIDTTVTGQVTFTIGGGGTLADGQLASICLDVLFAAVLGQVPIPCASASAFSAGTPVPLLCGSGGTMTLATLSAVINVGSYAVPIGVDPLTGCEIANLGTVGDPTLVDPAISDTIDITLVTRGSMYDLIQGQIAFDSTLLACSTDPVLSMTGGVTLGPDAPAGTLMGMTGCDDSTVGLGAGLVSFNLNIPGGTFVDGVLLRVTFDVPAPSPDLASTPQDPATPAFANVTCTVVDAAFGLTSPGIACGMGGLFEVKPPCVTRQCMGLRVFSGVDAAPDDFTLPTLDANNGPIEYDNDRWGSPVIMTSAGDGVFSSPDDRGDQQLQVYGLFNEAPLIERLTPSSGGIMSGGVTQYVFETASMGIAVDSEGLLTALSLNCCDTLLITYTPNFVSAVGPPCEVRVQVCVDAAGPDDVNPLDPADKRSGAMLIGDIDGEIPGQPSGDDPSTLGMGSTFDYDLWVNSGVDRVGAYQVTATFDGAVLAVDELGATYVLSRSSMMDPTFAVVNQGTMMSTVTLNDIAANGSSETGIFNLVGIQFQVLGSGVTPLTLSVDNLTSVQAGPDMIFGTADDILGDIGSLGPRQAVGASTTTGCQVTIP